MRAVFVVLAMAVAGGVWAKPFLVSDPSGVPQIDLCVYQDGITTPVATPVVNGGCKIDLAGFTSGNHNLQVWFRSSLWEVDSAKVPFVVSKPQAGGAGPAGLRLEDQ